MAHLLTQRQVKTDRYMYITEGNEESI